MLPSLSIAIDSGKFGGAKVTTGVTEAACTTTPAKPARAKANKVILAVRFISASWNRKSTPIDIGGRIGRVLESGSDGHRTVRLIAACPEEASCQTYMQVR